MINKNHIVKAYGFTCFLMLTISAVFLLSCKNVVLAKPVKVVIIGAEDFVSDKHNVVAGLPDALVARITERLVNSNKFEILERKALRRIIAEQGFGKEKEISDIDRLLDKAVNDLERIEAGTLAVAGHLSQQNDALNNFNKLGTMVGADYIIYAKIETFEKESVAINIPYSDTAKIIKNTVNTKLYLRVIDTRKGNIIGAESLDVQISKQAFSGKTPKISDLSVYDDVALSASNEIMDIIFPAYVVNENPYVINRGINDGVKVGDIYDVIREGEEITNLQGTSLEKVKSVVGKVTVTNVQETISTLNIINGNVIKGDLLVISNVESNVSKYNDLSISAKENSDNNKVINKKPRISVGLIKSGSTARKDHASDEHIPQFTDAIISYLTRTDRFTVIDRQETGQLLDEQMAQAMAENRDIPSAMGDLKGSDYMIYGSLNNFNIEDKKSTVPVLGEKIKSRIGYVEGNMRIVESRTGDVLVSRKISIKEKLDTDIENRIAAGKLADKYAEQVVATLINEVYPIKIAAVSGNKIYINRGSDGGFRKGDNLKVYRIENKLIDPDTGVESGFVKTEIATIEIRSTENSTSECLVVSGGALKKGDIAKRIPMIKTNKPGKVKKPNF